MGRHAEGIQKSLYSDETGGATNDGGSWQFLSMILFIFLSDFDLSSRGLPIFLLRVNSGGYVSQNQIIIKYDANYVLRMNIICHDGREVNDRA